MKKILSPLRYPGGKARLSDFLEDLILLNNLENSTMYEMYAGGAGASLSLLFSGIVSNIHLNDLDYHIYAIWYSILNRTNELIDLINESSVSIENWIIQKEIFNSPKEYDILEVGFSSFFLNRCNRSGIFNAGPIGGKKQDGNYKLDVRFNKDNLIQRIEKIALKKDNIKISNLESIKFLKEVFEDDDKKKFIFLDPPYYIQGENLYYNFYKEKNHLELSQLLLANNDKNWFLTYDNSNKIKGFYSDSKISYLPMTYTLQEKKKSKEIMVFSDSLFVPKQIRLGNNSKKVEILT